MTSAWMDGSTPLVYDAFGLAQQKDRWPANSYESPMNNDGTSWLRGKFLMAFLSTAVCSLKWNA